MTRLAYVLDANDGQTLVMGCERHGRLEKGRREAGVGCLSEVLRGPGVSVLQPASSAAHSGAGWAIGNDRLKPQGPHVVVRVVPLVVRGGTRTHTIQQS